MRIITTLILYILFSVNASAATYYVSSVAGDDSDGTTWAKAKLTITGGIALATANGDVVEVDSAHSHSYTSASASYNAPTSGTSIAVVSVDRNGSTTTGNNGRLAGASETIGTNGFAHNIATTNITQSIYMYGITMNGHTGSSNLNTINVSTSNAEDRANVTLESCVLNTPGSSTSGGGIVLGGTSSTASLNRRIKLINTSYVIRNTNSASGILLRNARIEISGASVSYAGANKPAFMFLHAGGGTQEVYVTNSDLSGYEKSGGYLFDGSGIRGITVIRKSKISATPGLFDSGWDIPSSSLTLINVDSGDTYRNFEYYTAYGSLVENTSIYADDGAQFNSLGISWQIVTTTLANEVTPFVTPWVHRWSDATSEIDVGFRIAHDSATDMNDRNLWSEIEYVSSSSFPIGTLASNRSTVAFINTATDWTNDSEDWTGISGFSNPNTQTLQSTFTPSEVSLLRGRIFVGVASKTLYLDPALRIEGQGINPPTRWVDTGAYNEAAGGSSTDLLGVF